MTLLHHQAVGHKSMMLVQHFAFNDFHCGACTADPNDKSLVCDVIDIKRPREQRWRVLTKRGSNSNESVNRPVKDLLPPRSSMAYAQCILTIWFVYLNMSQGSKYNNEPVIGTSDLVTVYQVRHIEMPLMCFGCNACFFLTSSLNSTHMCAMCTSSCMSPPFLHCAVFLLCSALWCIES